MIRLPEMIEKFGMRWVPLDELTRLPAGTRVALFGLIGWSGMVVAGLLTGLLGIEMAARGAAPVAAKEIDTAKLQRGSGEAILQRPLFSRVRQAALPVGPSQTPAPPATPLPALAARDSDVGLKGVFMNAPMVKAFLISAQNPAGAWVKPEEMFGGWKLVAVHPSDIELESGGQRITVPLGAGNPAKASGQANPNSQANVLSQANTSPPVNASSPAHEKNILQNFRPGSRVRP
jgi:hypothetical protein